MPNKLARPFHIGDIICYVDTTKYAPNYNGWPEPPPRVLLRCLVLSEGKSSRKKSHKGFKFDLLILTNNFRLNSGPKVNVRVTEWIPAYGKYSDTDKYFWETETPLTEATP